MKIKKRNIFDEITDENIDVLVHGCNCFCNMGAGIAREIKKRYPEVYLADASTNKGDKNKLGTFTHASVKVNNRSITIVNAYTQFNWNGNGVLADYYAIRSAFKKIKERFSGKVIIYPKIGAGLARGDWKIIESIIEDELAGEIHYCVDLKK